MLSLLFLFLFNPLPVFADDFNIQGDSSSNWYFQATAFTVEKFPDQGVILYDSADVLGGDTAETLSKEGISTLANMGYTRRIPGILDEVYGPPGTKIDVLYFYRNDTGHSVDIKKIALPVSRDNISNGDLSKVVKIDGVVDSKVDFLFSGNNLTRWGKYKYYNGMGTIGNGASNGFVLDSWYIQNPLKVEILNTQRVSDLVNMKVRIKNVSSDEYFVNLLFEHGSYQNLFTLLSQEEKIMEYQMEYQGNTLESFTVFNPNVKQRCAVFGGNFYQWTYTDSISVFAKRENDMWVGGGYVQPANQSFCISRTAYKFKSEPIYVDSEEVLSVTDGIKILPETNSNSILQLFFFVVLDLFLWYAFLRRRHKYEDKNDNTRLCTEGRKNARERGF